MGVLRDDAPGTHAGNAILKFLAFIVRPSHLVDWQGRQWPSLARILSVYFYLASLENPASLQFRTSALFEALEKCHRLHAYVEGLLVDTEGRRSSLMGVRRDRASSDSRCQVQVGVDAFV